MIGPERFVSRDGIYNAQAMYEDDKKFETYIIIKDLIETTFAPELHLTLLAQLHQKFCAGEDIMEVLRAA